MKNKTFLNEMTYILHNPKDCLKDDGINLIYEYIEDLVKNNSKYKVLDKLRDLEDEIEFYRDQQELCPECGGEFKTLEKYDNETLECFGYECRQPVYIRKCINCNYIDR